jgi:hypothetical protein
VGDAGEVGEVVVGDAERTVGVMGEPEGVKRLANVEVCARTPDKALVSAMLAERNEAMS